MHVARLEASLATKQHCDAIEIGYQPRQGMALTSQLQPPDALRAQLAVLRLASPYRPHDEPYSHAVKPDQADTAAFMAAFRVGPVPLPS